VFYQLVFDPGEQQRSVHTDVESWKWLGPVLLDALRQGNTTVAVGVAYLIKSSSRTEPAAVDPGILVGFFGEIATDAVEALSRIADQVDESQQGFVSDIVASAQSVLASHDSGTDSSTEGNLGPDNEKETSA
jgi:hypothetical protein